MSKRGFLAGLGVGVLTVAAGLVGRELIERKRDKAYDAAFEKLFGNTRHDFCDGGCTNCTGDCYDAVEPTKEVPKEEPFGGGDWMKPKTTSDPDKNPFVDNDFCEIYGADYPKGAGFYTETPAKPEDAKAEDIKSKGSDLIHSVLARAKAAKSTVDETAKNVRKTVSNLDIAAELAKLGISEEQFQKWTQTARDMLDDLSEGFNPEIKERINSLKTPITAAIAKGMDRVHMMFGPDTPLDTDAQYEKLQRIVQSVKQQLPFSKVRLEEVVQGLNKDLNINAILDNTILEMMNTSLSEDWFVSNPTIVKGTIRTVQTEAGACMLNPEYDALYELILADPLVVGLMPEVMLGGAKVTPTDIINYAIYLSK